VRKLYAYIFLSLFAISAGFAVLQQDLSKVEVKATKVAGNVYMIAGTDEATAFSGGNIGISVGKDGVIMVDSKFAPLAEKIRAAIREVGGDSPKYILNTHVHDDHVSGNAAFNADGTIIAHTNVRNRLVQGKPAELWPVITFDQSLSIHFNGEEIQVIHYPKGHTDGDAVVYFTGSNVVHMGDQFFSGIFPFVDLNRGGTVQGYIDNIKKILDRLQDDVKIIPGHGPVSTVADLRTNLRMLEETTAAVRAKMAAGESLEAIQKAGLPQEWQAWSWQFISTERWIETIYNSYAKNSGQ